MSSQKIRSELALNNTSSAIANIAQINADGVTLNGTPTTPSTPPSGTGRIFVDSTATPTELYFQKDDGSPELLSSGGPVSVLADVLVAGNATGGTDIEITSGDEITSTGDVVLRPTTGLSLPSAIGLADLSGIGGGDTVVVTADGVHGLIAFTGDSDSIPINQFFSVQVNNSFAKAGATVMISRQDQTSTPLRFFTASVDAVGGGQFTINWQNGEGGAGVVPAGTGFYFMVINTA